MSDKPKEIIVWVIDKEDIKKIEIERQSNTFDENNLFEKGPETLSGPVNINDTNKSIIFELLNIYYNIYCKKNIDNTFCYLLVNLFSPYDNQYYILIY